MRSVRSTIGLHKLAAYPKSRAGELSSLLAAEPSIILSLNLNVCLIVCKNKKKKNSQLSSNVSM